VLFNKEFLPFVEKENNFLILEADLKLLVWLLPSIVTWDTSFKRLPFSYMQIIVMWHTVLNST